MYEKNKEYSVLKQACMDLHKNECDKYQMQKNYNCKYSKRYKRRMNRTGREKIGLKDALHPEVDNAFERTRSKIMCWWNK